MANNQIALLAKAPVLPTASERETTQLNLQALRDAGTVRTQALADDAATREVYKANPDDPQARLKALYAINPKAAMAAEKAGIDMNKDRATASKTEIEGINLRTARYKDALSTVQDRAGAAQWVQAMYQDPDIGKHIAQELGPVEAAVARIPDPATNPQGFAAWKRGSQLGAEKLAEISKPVIGNRDLGGTVQTTATDPFTGVPTVTATNTKTQTPDSVATDARVASEGRLNRQNQLDIQDRKANANAPTLPGASSGTLDGTDAIVQAIIDGRKALSAAEMKSPYGQNLMALVAKKDPAFDLVNYGARAKTRNDFVAGKSAENIKAINTAIAHMGALDEQMTSLGNSDSPVYNTAANWLGKNVGRDPALQEKLASVSATAEGVAGEMAKVFRSTGMSEHEINAWREKFKDNTTPAGQRGTMRAAMHMLQGRMDAIGEQYTNGMGTSAQPLTMLTPEAQQIFDRLNGGKGAPKAARPAAATPAQMPGVNAQGWRLHKDASGKQAYVSPDGKQFQEVQ